MMGVCEDNKSTEKQSILIEDDLKKVTSSPRRKSSKHKSPKRCKPENNSYDMPSAPRGKGKRRLRRFENLKYLLSLVENEDLEEMDIGNFVEPTMSAFAELLAEQEKMKVWNDFVNHTEEEQNFFLQNKQYSDEVEESSESGESSSKNAQDKTDEWVTLDADDKREAHPAYSADDCFKRIDANLKAVLHKRHVATGVLTHLEEQIKTFFKEWPTSVYVQQLPTGFERLLLHAVCQYLDLKSHSFCCQGVRQTEVENKHETFTPPDTSLCSYLESKMVMH